MKKLSSILLIGLLVIISSCKKTDSNCSRNVEIKGSNHLVDLSVLKTVPQMLDSLEKYPNLQAASIVDDEYMTSLTCNFLHQNKIVFGASYQLIRSKKFNYFKCINNTPKAILPTNLPQNISNTKAIEIAKNEINFGNNCLSYQLGFAYQDSTNNESTNSYKLVWQVKSIGGQAQQVMLDASTGKVYYKFDGICY